jgi:hypothetical protein
LVSVGSPCELRPLTRPGVQMGGHGETVAEIDVTLKSCRDFAKSKNFATVSGGPRLPYSVGAGVPAGPFPGFLDGSEWQTLR